MIKHISAIEYNERTAANLAAEALHTDQYHRVIAMAAVLLVGEGEGHFIYHTQFIGGGTLWKHGDDARLIRPEDCKQ